MKTFILAALLTVTAVSGAVVTSQPAAAGCKSVMIRGVPYQVCNVQK